MKISVISLIAYDCRFLPSSIATYYDYVDEIVLGLDENRISWSNNPFSFNETELWQQLGEIDKDGKIKIIEHNFHPNKIALDNDTYTRNFLKSHCTYDLILSFDADEELVNAKEFFHKWLPIASKYIHKVDFSFTWFLPMKKIDDKILMICNNDNTWFRGDTQGFATDKNSTYNYCRWTNKPKVTLSPLTILHWSFCRTPEELLIKSQNFGHSNKTNEDPFYHNWQVVNMDNYQHLRNFKSSGFGNNQWEKLVPVLDKDLYQIAAMQSGLCYQ